MRITLPSGAPAELAEPAGEASLGLALCPDVMGLRPLFDDLCARLAAEQGWTVCAIEPFAGREDEALEVRMASPLREHLLDDLLAAADRTGCERTAVMGFCLGGMVALRATGLGRFDRAVSFYGMIRVPQGWWTADGVEPLTAVADTDAAETLAVIAGLDHYTPPEDVEALRRSGRALEAVVYPEADHGFVHDPARPAHRPADAADAWRRVVDFLNRP